MERCPRGLREKFAKLSTCESRSVGSNPTLSAKFALVAQRIESSFPKRYVAGSNPAKGANLYGSVAQWLVQFLHTE
jgi:hypothetical protein